MKTTNSHTNADTAVISISNVYLLIVGTALAAVRYGAPLQESLSAMKIRDSRAATHYILTNVCFMLAVEQCFIF